MNSTFFRSASALADSRATRRHHILLASAAAAALCAPAIAQAQDTTLEEIVVTAQKREQRLQDVPVSITAISTETLASARVTNVRDLAGLAPNLQVREQPGGGAQPSFTMRGLINLGTTAGADKGVAVYVDGVFLGGTQASVFELPDLERVEVLRGPQGTLFGRNATGGAISFVTSDPSGELGFKQRVSVGNLGTLRTTSTFSTPTFGGFSGWVSYTHSEQDGDIKNLGGGTKWDFSPAYGGKPTYFTSPDKLGGYNLESVVAKLKFEASDSFKIVYRYDWTEQHFSGGGFGSLYESPTIRAIKASQPSQANLTQVNPKRPDAVNNWDTVPSDMKVWGHTATAQWQISDAFALKNIMALRKAEYLGPFSNFTGQGGLINTGIAQFAFVGLANVPPSTANPAGSIGNQTLGAPFLPNATTSGGSDRQFSDELQLNYNSDFLTLTVGAIYFRNRNMKYTAGEDAGIGRARSGAFRVYPNFTVPYAGQPAGGGGRPTNILIKSTAAYGQAEFHVTPQLDLVAGVRYTKDRKTGIDNSVTSLSSPTNYVVNYKDDRWTYSLNANYKFDNDKLFYVKYSTGFISGGPAGDLTYQPEIAKSLEGGLKADWFGRILRTNLAVFHVKYDNIQQAVQGSSLNPTRPLITQAITNAGRAQASGFELETTLIPVNGVVLTGNVGYTDFKFKDLPTFLTAGNSDFFPAFRAKWTANLSGQYTTDIAGDSTFTARLDGNWKSRQYGISSFPNESPALGFNATERAAYLAASQIAPYWMVNARASFDNIEWGGTKVGVAFWSKNLFNNRSPQFTQAVSSFFIAASFERARTYGADLTIEF